MLNKFNFLYKYNKKGRWFWLLYPNSHFFFLIIFHIHYFNKLHFFVELLRGLYGLRTLTFSKAMSSQLYNCRFNSLGSLSQIPFLLSFKVSWDQKDAGVIFLALPIISLFRVQLNCKDSWLGLDLSNKYSKWKFAFKKIITGLKLYSNYLKKYMKIYKKFQRRDSKEILAITRPAYQCDFFFIIIIRMVYRVTRYSSN